MGSTYTLSPECTLFHADCRDALKVLPDNCLDSIVTDPPYGLQFMGKEWDKLWRDKSDVDKAWRDAHEGTLAARARKLPDYSTMSQGAEMQATHLEWAREAFRVLKPGGHIAAFSASRTYHRMACAIEDAGFEMRDSLMWLYGTGFPKSHDVSKGIDKRGPPGQAPFAEFAEHYESQRSALGFTHAKVCAAGGWHGAVNHGGSSVNWANGYGMPTVAQWAVLQPLLGLDDRWKERVEREEYEREKIGERAATLLAVAPGQDNDRSVTTLDVTRAGSPQAAEWEGWGTALKPAFEPIVLARKPLSENTVAANVLRWRTGALNIGACRVGTDPNDPNHRVSTGGYDDANGGMFGVGTTKRPENLNAAGRWPANVVTDGSTEVIEAFPHTKSGAIKAGGPGGRDMVAGDSDNTRRGGRPPQPRDVAGSEGSAARFFYSAKANARDRNGSKHPTVKPISLMAWLARLITPPGGIVLDPFAGSGTTGSACAAEGFKCILVEREAEYVADIVRRLGPVESPPLVPAD